MYSLKIWKQNKHNLNTTYFIAEINIFYTQLKHNLFLTTNYIYILYTTITYFKYLLYIFYTQFKHNLNIEQGYRELEYRIE